MNSLRPRTVVLAFAAMSALFAAATVGIRTHTRDAYRAVGFNDGRLHEREQLVATIRQAVTLQPCHRDRGEALPTELLSIKAESFFIQNVEDDSFRFCR
jgi:hypothetical protein